MWCYDEDWDLRATEPPPTQQPPTPEDAKATPNPRTSVARKGCIDMRKRSDFSRLLCGGIPPEDWENRKNYVPADPGTHANALPSFQAIVKQNAGWWADKLDFYLRTIA